MTTALEHDAFIYSSSDEYLATTVPFLLEGVAAGEGVVVATHDHNRVALEDALGPSAGRVMFVPSSDVYRSPHAAVAAYHSVLSHFAAQGKARVRAIGEVAYGPDERAHDAWLRYEPIAHAIFEGAPLSVICPYDARALPSRLVDHARRTHPHLAAAGSRLPSPDFVRPEEMIRTLPQRTAFGMSGAPDVSVGAAGSDVRPVRHMISDALAGRLSAQRAEEASIAIGEVLANGVRHGAGRVSAALWSHPDAIVCRIHNDGPAIGDSFAGYRPPVDPENGGMGLWIARQLSDEMAITNDARGPIVTMAFRR